MRSRCVAVDLHRVTHARGRAGPVARSPPNTLAEVTLGVASTLPHAHRALRRVCQCTQLVHRSRFGQGNTRSRARRAGCAVSSKHSGRANRADPECRLTAFTCVPQPCHTRSGHCIECAYIRSGRPAIDSHRVTHARGRALSRHSGRRDSGCRLTTFTFAAPRHCYQRNMRCGECSIARHECVPIDSHRVTHARGRAGPAARSPPSTLCRLTTCTFASPTRSHAKWALCRVC